MKVIYTMKNSVIQEFQHLLESKLIDLMHNEMFSIQFVSTAKLIQIESIEVDQVPHIHLGQGANPNSETLSSSESRHTQSHQVSVYSVWPDWLSRLSRQFDVHRILSIQNHEFFVAIREIATGKWSASRRLWMVIDIEGESVSGSENTTCACSGKIKGKTWQSERRAGSKLHTASSVIDKIDLFVYRMVISIDSMPILQVSCACVEDIPGTTSCISWQDIVKYDSHAREAQKT
jgi:hypothetical protein